MTRRAVLVGALAATVIGARWTGVAQDAQAPVFRTAVNLVELDVSVLDRDRRPVRGLVAGDFTITEDGRQQRVVAVSHVDVAVVDPARSARMRFATRDIAANDLGEEIGDGRLVAIVFDDVNLPADDPDIVRGTREVARYIVDELGPSDMAAVVYAHQGGRSQDFTSDRTKLLEAIDRFQPVTLDLRTPTPTGMGPGGGDMIQRWSPTLMRSSCMRNEPAVPTLDTVASRMATAPGRRKALVFLSIGVAMSLTAGSGCGGELNAVMRDVYRKAQRANVNIYAIDPTGRGGYVDYLRASEVRRQQDAAMGLRPRPVNTRAMQDFMRAAADNTGGRAIVNTDAIESEIDRLLEEDRSYYLVGYEPTNLAPDGKFRKVEVKVNRPDVSVRSRSGYWAARPDEIVERRTAEGPTTNDASLAGLLVSQGVPIRAHAVAIGLTSPAPTDRRADVLVSLSLRFPAVRTPTTDSVTLVRNVYDESGNPGPPTRDIVQVPLAPGSGEVLRHEVIQRLSLAPGRYQVRYNAQSTVLGRNGTVYADVEVPDFRRLALGLSGVVLARAADVPAGLTPLERPTSARDFASNETLAAWLRVYQGGAAAPVPVTLVAEVWDAEDRLDWTTTKTIEPTEFDSGRAADFTIDVPLTGLEPGPHLLNVTARLPGGRTERRDILIRVR
jgi:VWFA-related protein